MFLCCAFDRNSLMKLRILDRTLFKIQSYLFWETLKASRLDRDGKFKRKKKRNTRLEIFRRKHMKVSSQPCFSFFPRDSYLSLPPSFISLSLSLGPWVLSLFSLSPQPPGYLICSYSNCSCSGEIALIHTIPPILGTECTVVNCTY